MRSSEGHPGGQYGSVVTVLLLLLARCKYKHWRRYTAEAGQSLQTRWVLFGGYCDGGGYTILERLQLFTEMFSEPDYITRPCLVLELPCLVSTYISFYIIEIPTVIAASKGKVSDIEEFI